MHKGLTVVNLFCYFPLSCFTILLHSLPLYLLMLLCLHLSIFFSFPLNDRLSLWFSFLFLSSSGHRIFYFNQIQLRFLYSPLCYEFLHFSVGFLCLTLCEVIWRLERSFWAGWTDGSFFHKSSWLSQGETYTLHRIDDVKSCWFNQRRSLIQWNLLCKHYVCFHLYARMEILPTSFIS